MALSLATVALLVFHTPVAALAFFGVVVVVFITTVFASTPANGGREV
ncbi:hypothetical protein [Skermanella stibiiresistens]|nr:hypothetical protein [Skermanella stibiiresistens]